MYISKIALTILGVLLLVAAGVGLAYVKFHGFSARAKPSALESFVAEHLYALSIPSSAKSLRNPLPATALNIAEARDHFADHCAVCHANNGSGRTETGANLYPPAPDMRDSGTQSLPDGKLLYIIKNGVRFTGMPGWGGDDEENWKLVLFIRHLPHLDPKELSLMKEVNQMEAEEPMNSTTH